jgi:mono/diheme cytochrome c family protein
MKRGATAGKRVYDAQCASCHDGGSMGPGLKGDDFLATWENKMLRVLYTRMQETMPSDAPGTLQEQELLDLMAYLVRANGFAPGTTGFSVPTDLDTIKIVRAK